MVYAFLSDTSVARLFLAGIIPGILIGASLMLFNRAIAARRDDYLASLKIADAGAREHPDGEPELTSMTALLEEIIPRAAESDTPLPVADAQGNIVGCIDRTGLLQALARAPGA